MFACLQERASTYRHTESTADNEWFSQETQRQTKILHITLENETRNVHQRAHLRKPAAACLKNVLLGVLGKETQFSVTTKRFTLKTCCVKPRVGKLRWNFWQGERFAAFVPCCQPHPPHARRGSLLFGCLVVIARFSPGKKRGLKEGSTQGQKKRPRTDPEPTPSRPQTAPKPTPNRPQTDPKPT